MLSDQISKRIKRYMNEDKRNINLSMFSCDLHSSTLDQLATTRS